MIMAGYCYFTFLFIFSVFDGIKGKCGILKLLLSFQIVKQNYQPYMSIFLAIYLTHAWKSTAVFMFHL